jgi:hypothetical protein
MEIICYLVVVVTIVKLDHDDWDLARVELKQVMSVWNLRSRHFRDPYEHVNIKEKNQRW